MKTAATIYTVLVLIFVSFSLITMDILPSSASIGTECKGPPCDDANGWEYSTLQVGEDITCCGISDPNRGKKKES